MPDDLRPELDPEALSVAHFPAGWWPPSALTGYTAIVADVDEVTLVAPDSAFAALDEPVAIECGWRRITFAGPLPWEMIGFLADVAGRLAGARIPFTSMSGFTTDHVLVRAAQAELALAVLRGEPSPDQRPDVTNP
ncbi:MAG: ACT domain-containing protein [Actinobacteria bacterium]|nr:ACT domain-containing protein [Actinomycetota bacterium]